MGYTNGMEEEEEEDIRIEKEIEIELSKISITSSETDDTDIELSAEISSDSEPISDELPESVLHYLNFVRSRSQNAERLILQDLENDEISNDFYKVVPNNASECLAKLASKYNEDPEELRKRVLSEIEDEELEMSSTPVKAFEPNNGGAISSSNGVADRYYLTDDGDTGVSFSFQEVEERCKREYELWVEQQKELECEQIKKQKAKRDMEQIQSKEEEKRRQLRQEELMAEQKKLEMLHVQQQAMLEEERLKEEEAWNEQLRQHKELIKNLHVQIEEEKKAFEEQKAKERQQLAEQHNMAAVKIQTRFRGFVVYKKYAPILREWRAELKRKREMQGSMEREQKEKEERLKRRALEKKQQGEGERQKQEEKERQELAEKKRRHEEYEKKKEIIRLQREEQQMLETLKREKDQLKFVVASKMEPENKEKETTLAKDQEIEKVEEHEENKTAQIQSGVSSENANNLEMIKKEEQDSTIGKPKMILEKEQTKLLEEIRYEENKQDEKHYGMKHEKLWHNNGSTEGRELGKVIPNKISVENKVPYVEDNCSTIVEFQRSSDTSALNTETTAVVNWESSTLSNHISMDAQLDSGDTGQTDKLNALEQIKKELALKEMHEEATDHWAKGENLVPCLEQSLMLSDSVEEKRLAWMKTCKSWSRIYRENQRKKVLEKSRTRKVSASMMPPLSAVMIIQADPWNSLQQVTTVNFQDLPGCSLSTLSQCSKLQFLSLRRCGLLTLEGLSSCKDLKYINVEENNIQVINCENLENLCILILNNNNISSLHGLYGCNNLWNLELSHNKLTRIVGLKSLKNLQRLVVNHNQLISTKGLSDTPSLVYIDCSFNHLTHVEGIENCGLLQILKLQGNNLIELPSLEDHVLLRELYLEDNSISSLEKLSLYWLPLLQILFISQNSLTHLAPLLSFLSLEELDLSNNCLLDLQSVIQCLNGCHNLRELSLCRNPLLQEENWRCSLLKFLPGLKILNSENISSDAGRIRKKPEPGSFAAFCHTQIQEIGLISKKATTGLTEFSVDAVQLQCWYLKKLMKVSNEHRYAHEYGVLNTTKGEEPEKQTNHLNQEAINVTEKNNSFIAGAKENIQDMLHMPERWITSDHIQPVSVNSFMALPEMGRNKEYKQKKQCVHNEESKDNNVLISPKRNKFSKRITASNGGNYLQHFDSLQNLAATVIQSYWRSYSVRKKINFYTRLHLAATIIQSFWRSYCLRKKMVVNNKEQHKLMDKHKAATIIQAFWKGFCLRKKLATALAAVKTDEVEDDYKEVNVDDFMFDEAVIEKEWPALDSTRFLSQTVLFSNQFPSPKYNETAKHEEKSHHFKWPPHKTWQLRERPASLLSENSQISNRSGQSTLSRLTDLKHSQKSSLRLEKEEKISEEWGFKEISTAQLMLRRAHKMKAKKASSKKLDPAVRLALFKNNENKHPPVKPPKKATGKAGYFEDKEDELAHIDKVAEKIERNKERTYQWLHTQVWDYEEASPRNEKCKHFLPEIDPEILKGGRVQLVTSPVRREDTDLELVSMTSGSTLTQNREKNNQPQRHSAGSSKKDAPAPERSHLGPSHKERISFRDHPVQLSGGWGSGKKKMKPLK
ncbi:leucine-rich repeat and IQ domain-containing protein 1 isoform X2 [Hemicordylus capensis]|uniref:leucine-rich repeat and IQ domain-containing protein 1 isoform X2 n=1 Tax=Hemicordylus capensis TaxID=884348 RepID=UPI00230401CB|nr:leucine-rich repeat and IQ domain-containing protein 1 isoform X2 [Hemicordylus capensis]